MTTTTARRYTAVVGDAAPSARGGIPGYRAFNNRQRTAIVDAPISVPADGGVSPLGILEGRFVDSRIVPR
jgi:hypothetical protein